MGKFKSKKKKKHYFLKIICIVLTIYISFHMCMKFLVNNFFKKDIYNKKNVNILLKSSTSNLYNKKEKNNILSFLTSPSFLLQNSLSNIKKVNDEYFKDLDDEETYKKLKEQSGYIENPSKKEVKDPVVYIYNTHQLENYQMDENTGYAVSPNVLLASYNLKEKLDKLNINAIVEDGNISEYLSNNNWKYSYSYKASRHFIEEKLAKYNTFKYIIDLHRDSIDRNKTTLEANNKVYAKTLFLIGTDFAPNDINLNLASTACDYLNSEVNGICKGILKKGGKGVNGIYNQDIFNGSMLIEVGGQENTMTEVNNTLDVYAKVIKKLVDKYEK